MRNFSLPPYVLGEIGFAVKRISEQLSIECQLCSISNLKSQGYYSLPALSEDMARIGAKYGIVFTVTGDLKQTGIQLQQLIDALSVKGIAISL